MTKENDINFSSLQKRIAYILSEISDSIPVIAENLGVNKNTIAAYKKCKGDLKGVVIENLVSKYNVNPSWLFANEGPIYKGSTQEMSDDSDLETKVESNFRPELDLTEDHPPAKIHGTGDRIHIPQATNPESEGYNYSPMAKAVLNAGGGSFVLSEETTGRYYAFRERFLKAIATSPKNLILMKVTGDSMEPKIEDGDTVGIDTGRRTLKNGTTYALGYEDLIVIKDVEIMPGGKAMIISKNRKFYAPYEIDINEIRIIGQVIWMDRVLFTRH